MKTLCVAVAVVCALCVVSARPSAQGLQRLLARLIDVNENKQDQQQEKFLTDKQAAEDSLVEQLARSLLAKTAQVKKQQGPNNPVEEMAAHITCADIDRQLIEEFYREPEANLQCVYGYQFQDWIDTFDEIRNNPGPRSSDLVRVMNCLGDIMVPLFQETISGRTDMTVIDNDCSGVWTGRYASQNRGHPYVGCDELLDEAHLANETLYQYVTDDTACIMHKDMSLLEAVISAVGAQGPLGLLQGVAPVELCVFNVLRRDAQWYRVNHPDSIGICYYRLETRAMTEEEYVEELVEKMLRKRGFVA